MTQDITKSVFAAEQYDSDWPPTELLAFKGWIDEMLEQIPEQFHENASISIGSDSGYEGSSHANLTISYTRPETKEEALSRTRQADAMRESNDKRERQLYAQLKAKYEAKP
jgi:hypothetical protein